ncbi:MAG TPA: cation:proton antiporter [Gemmatimonadales bacterium]|nr:cation:proton antiporter [Gemmatimonadales bacterium]
MQWLTLAFTFIVMAVLQRLARGGPLEARATLALGFLTVAAYIAGSIAQRVRLPRIVGFLVAGFVAGPAWLELVRGDELQALGAIASGALALIAFAAGSELTLDALRGERRIVTLRIAAGAMAVPFIAVTLVVLTVSAWFPLTAHQPFEDALTVALALGALATVGSPTLTWAVMSDLDTRGPLSGTIRDVTIVQAVAAALLLIIVLGLALPLASPGVVTPGVATHALLILGGSIALGGALGFAAAQYVRAIHGRLEWVLLILAFIVFQTVRLVGLDAVLVALAAGCTLRNAAPAESERIRAELKRCAVPVYVVFFALAGSSLQLDALGLIWPWALLLVGLRATGLWAGLRWAGRHQAVSPDLVDYGWLGLVSQGGLAITLAAVLRRAFPEWNVSLEALVVAMIGVHQLAGPICFQWALRRAGEVTAVGEGTHVRESPGTAADGSRGDGGGGGGGGGGAAGVVASGSSVY